MQKPIYFRNHSRDFLRLNWVYPVISRRSQGVSIGINLSQDLRCTFHCNYCFVNRKKDCAKIDFSPIDFLEELDFLFDYINSGLLWQEKIFDETPIDLRQIKDITIAGNGEPTLQSSFIHSLETLYTWLEYRQQNLKLIVLTNGLHLRNQDIHQTLKNFQINGGEISVKLDATNALELSNNNGVFYSWDTYFDLLRWTARNYDITIQTMIYYNSENNLSINIKRYISQIKKLNRIKEIQLLTLARIPQDKGLKPIPPWKLKLLHKEIQQHFPNIPVRYHP